MPTKICVMLDGGYVRALCKQTNRPPKDPAYIEKIAKACQAQDEVIHRIMFYDSGGFYGNGKAAGVGTGEAIHCERQMAA
jgi:hypothetical protein